MWTQTAARRAELAVGHAIDDHARKLHAAGAGTPAKQRGPAPTRRYAPRHEAKPEAPGEKLVALAEALRFNTDGGGAAAPPAPRPRHGIRSEGHEHPHRDPGRSGRPEPTGDRAKVSSA